MTIITNYSTLTKSELRVAELLVIGDSNKIIAHKLGIAENTVKVHIRSMFKKFGVTNRTAASMILAKMEKEPIKLPTAKPVEKQSNKKSLYYLLTPSEWEDLKQYIPEDYWLYNGNPRSIELQGV